MCGTVGLIAKGDCEVLGGLLVNILTKPIWISSVQWHEMEILWDRSFSSQHKVPYFALDSYVVVYSEEFSLFSCC